jgi:hypothetical protein
MSKASILLPVESLEELGKTSSFAPNRGVVMNCNECKFAVLEDFGYSNYTTEGTNFRCGIDKHPNGQFDNFYGEAKELNYASDCPFFTAGNAIIIDCECEAVAELNEEERSIYEGTYKT